MSDIADIRERSKPDASNAYIANHKQSPVQTVRFDVYKASSANITQTVTDSKELTEKMIKPYEGQFTISSVLNAGEEIDRQYYDLIRDLLITVVLVFITLFLFL